MSVMYNMFRNPKEVASIRYDASRKQEYWRKLQAAHEADVIAKGNLVEKDEAVEYLRWIANLAEKLHSAINAYVTSQPGLGQECLPDRCRDDENALDSEDGVSELLKHINSLHDYWLFMCIKSPSDSAKSYFQGIANLVGDMRSAVLDYAETQPNLAVLVK